MCVKYGRKLPRLTISKRSTVNSNVSLSLCFNRERVLLILASVSLDFRYSQT